MGGLFVLVLLNHSFTDSLNNGTSNTYSLQIIKSLNIFIQISQHSEMNIAR